MRTLARASAASTSGYTIPSVFDTLASAGVLLRRSELSMIAGQPGAGKSTIALTLALRSGVRTLYFAADTSAHTMALRSLAALTNRPQPEIEKWMADDPVWAKSTLTAHTGHIRWCFDSAPSLDDIRDEIAVYEEVMGDSPELIIVDNAIDVTHQDGDEWSSLRSLMRELKWWARDTEAAILVLHHTSEGTEGHPCPPRRAIHGKVSQTPALIVTVADQPGFMALCAVKNRNGKADSSGQDASYLVYNPETMLLADIEER